MSPTTLESTIIAEIESKQIPSTPRQVRDKMVEAVNAANGLRYEIARFGDIEQQLKALQQKTEPLVLRAKELSDLVCQHVVDRSGATWKAEALRLRDELTKREEIMRAQGDEIRRLTVESDALRNEMASLKHQTQWECICGGTDCEGQKENAELREDRELLNFLLNRGVCWRGCDKELEGEYWTVGHETEWLYGLDRGRERIRAAIDAARKEGQP